jgi:hypothetical protein
MIYCSIDESLAWETGMGGEFYFFFRDQNCNADKFGYAKLMTIVLLILFLFSPSLSHCESKSIHNCVSGML